MESPVSHQTPIDGYAQSSDSPLVSVIVPAYRVKQYLRHCVESLLRQTYRNLEVLIIDDCSPDETSLIVDQLAQQDARITAIHLEENQGHSGARNTGLACAKGDYITFVDADDWVEPDYIEYLLGILWQTGSDISMSYNFFTSRFSEQILSDRITTITPEDMLCDIFYNRIHVGVWNRMYKRSIIGERRFCLEAKTGEGMQFNTQVVPRANRIGVGLRRVYTYNVDNDFSVTKHPNIDKQAYGAIRTMDIIKQSLIPRSQRLDKAVEYQYFTTALYALMHLIRAGACAEHADFYRKLVRYVRDTAPKTFSMEISFKQKIKSLLVWVSPYLTIRLSILWRYQLGMKQRV